MGNLKLILPNSLSVFNDTSIFTEKKSFCENSSHQSFAIQRQKLLQVATFSTNKASKRRLWLSHSPVV
ncbi:unnamed protein product [Arabidopsis lyrata]|uniref:Expressed protein n=1 Tax=Arabidopsis lyrata subsp. lyrata TaxID=81972 RepID=D7KYS6_ARALL|nr:expressed protein [Arabidopsis lyrata subsp. lyrata]CAH8257816.1 unnamed protein product [Arabidopsis lyrata]